MAEAEGDNKTTTSVTFKTVKKRQLRVRKISDDDEDKEPEDEVNDLNAKVDETRELQKLRKRHNGVNAVGLAIGKNISVDEGSTNKDLFKVKSGGMLNMSALKQGNVKQVDDAYDTGIGTQFSAETNKRDEDEEMMKYIEDQLSRRKGPSENTSSKEEQDSIESSKISDKYYTPEEAALQAVPDHLRQSTTYRSEEMLSNQMLSGIPEVDLGIESKIRNIEATEEAKLKLLWEQRNKKEEPSQFVPTNMTVNFIHHNRFNIDDAEKQKKRKLNPKPPQPDTKAGGKASDDFHFEKFKKQYRRFH